MINLRDALSRLRNNSKMLKQLKDVTKPAVNLDTLRRIHSQLADKLETIFGDVPFSKAEGMKELKKFPPFRKELDGCLIDLDEI
jgi:hypothetical protein